MTTEFEADSYLDSCALCGTAQLFERTKVAIRETYQCKVCKALLREREQARAILTIFSQGSSKFINELIQQQDFSGIRIFEPGTAGPFRRYFRQLPSYSQSDFYENSADAEKTPDIPHQTLESLTYADAAFDLVATSDILEHVRRPRVAFAEIARVLRVGGYHIFTVPMQHPVPVKTIIRVQTDSALDIHVLPAHYHGNGKGGRSLVYTDFGSDITMLLAAAGFSTYFLHPSTQSDIVNRVVTVICQRVR
jgi:SAM-dependent methyltransferase